MQLYGCMSVMDNYANISPLISQRTGGAIAEGGLMPHY